MVIVGGGAGGGTVGRILKTEAPDLEITVVEARPTYTSCFNSNHYFGGFRTFASLQHSYDGLKKLGIKVVNDTATAIDAGKKSVTLAGGQALPYDRLVLSPGIDFNYGAIEGYSAAAREIMPHAWKAGPQTLLLMQQLEAMDDGGVVVMTVPGNPYRCPPGPYERACMIAHYLKTHKPKSKLVIFDAKPTFSKQGAFEEAFEKYYHGIIDLNLTNEIDNFEVVRVDTKSMEVETKSGIKLKGAVVNVIPPQTAGDIAISRGLRRGRLVSDQAAELCLRPGRGRLRHRRCRHCRRYAEVGLLCQQSRQGRRRRHPRRSCRRRACRCALPQHLLVAARRR